MAKVVVIGGTGLIGSKLVSLLVGQGAYAVPASLDTGVNTLTGDGLATTIADARVVVDVSNSPSFEDHEVMDFFTTSTSNLLAEAAGARVSHYVALSVVGTQRLADSPYFRAKSAQERLIRESGVAYSIVQATQFFEFASRIASSATVDGQVRLSPALIQPIAADDVATAIARTATGEPIDGTVEVAGPERLGLDELVRKWLTTRDDPRQVVTDPRARYFGAALQEDTLLPGADATIYPSRFDEWTARQ
jgi:uncharacterized protein YbjT (DUF2867 family)